jgi:hypothetical protein
MFFFGPVSVLLSMRPKSVMSLFKIRITIGSAWLALAGLVAAGCIYDSNDRCGPHMMLSDIATCVCVDGYVLENTACVACPEREHEKNGACVCDDGLQRLSEGAACTDVPEAGLGAVCSNASPCLDPEFSLCAAASNGDRYCTSSGCSTLADCPAGYDCAHPEAGASFCRRSPVGQGATCAGDADCAGGEATFCEPLFSHACLVQGCSLTANDCFDGWECCDVSAYNMPIPICIPAGNCP